jgi:alpha-beta hydrolase superfamily lysophospholipase
MGSRRAALHGADPVSAPRERPGKRYVQLAEGTHTIIMEKNRLKLFEAVQAFLDEQGRS